LIADLALRGRGSNVPKPVIRTGSPSQIVLVIVSDQRVYDFSGLRLAQPDLLAIASISSALFIVTS
jgi:hypothetical protein